MFKRRWRRARYRSLVRRLLAIPGLVALPVALLGCSSRPAADARNQAPAPVESAAAREPSATNVDSNYEWRPESLPIELRLAPELRTACGPELALPPSLRLEQGDEVMDALEPIASCLTIGPLQLQRLHLFGSSQSPGRWDAPFDAAGRADQLRTSLSLLGVPFGNLVTHDVDDGERVRLVPGSG